MDVSPVPAISSVSRISSWRHRLGSNHWFLGLGSDINTRFDHLVDRDIPEILGDFGPTVHRSGGRSDKTGSGRSGNPSVLNEVSQTRFNLADLDEGRTTCRGAV